MNYFKYLLLFTSLSCAVMEKSEVENCIGKCKNDLIKCVNQMCLTDGWPNCIEKYATKDGCYSTNDSCFEACYKWL